MDAIFWLDNAPLSYCKQVICAQNIPGGLPPEEASGRTRKEAIIRIVDLREVTAPIASPIANAYIDFFWMTCSLVAVVTDGIVEGRPVIGYGFNTNGRFQPHGGFPGGISVQKGYIIMPELPGIGFEGK